MILLNTPEDNMTNNVITLHIVTIQVNGQVSGIFNVRVISKMKTYKNCVGLYQGVCLVSCYSCNQTPST